MGGRRIWLMLQRKKASIDTKRKNNLIQAQNPGVNMSLFTYFIGRSRINIPICRKYEK